MSGSLVVGAGAGSAVARQLVRRSRLELDAALAGADPQMRFLHAHMAAIRAAAAVLALGAGSPRRRRRVVSVWEQLAEAGEPWQTWASLFAAGAPVRAAIESGRAADLPGAAADAAVSAVEGFLEEVEAAIRVGDLAAAPIAS